MNISCYNSIPGSVVAYWVSKNFIDIFNRSVSLSSVCKPTQGMATGDNERFLRHWYEVDINKEKFNATDSINAFASGSKWFPYNKGGEYRKWFGNQDYMVNYFCDGKEIKSIKKNGKIASRVQNSVYYFFKSLSWSKICSSSVSFRYYPSGFIFDVAGCSVFTDDEDYQMYIFGILNSKVTKYILKVLAPTLNFEVGQISTLPVILVENKFAINDVTKKNVEISELEWDSFETSWNFKRHPLI